MDDCLVIGAGPAGSHVAYLLASQGHRVTVLEQQATVGKGSRCTGVLGKECLERYPLAREAIIREAPSARLYSPGGQSLRVHREPAQAWVVDRDRLDELLARRAQGAGARYLLGTQVAALQVAGHGVEAMADHDGEQSVLRAATVVVATGFASPLPQKLGLGRLSDSVMAAQAEVQLAREAEVEVYLGQSVAPGFFAWLVPTYPGRAWLGLFSRRQPGLYLRRLIDALHQKGRLISPQARVTSWGIPLRPVPRTYAPRALVVGDAAGQVKPTTGGGVYYGQLCAEVAAETLHRALDEGDFSGARFAQYEQGWRKLIGRELQVGYYARLLYERLNDSHIERLFTAVQSNGLHKTIVEAEDFSFDWHAEFILRTMKQTALRAPLLALGALLPAPLRRRLQSPSG
ncbi:MAG: NAD(P)/FAD-dependent oxidoreductase [Chloroflexi bacterium]|nr:NAD(P)/FAD-dependent oxidoreductase [Chloroflexota bacterium]